VDAMKHTIALVDDDRNILTSVSMTLEAEGFQVRTFTDGESALAGIMAKPVDLAVLDIKMPRMDGMELLQRLRSRSQLPVIFLTSKDEEVDQLMGLRLGADDYITKPFSQRLLLERIRALLRRRPPRGAASLEVGDLQLNPDTREVHRGEREIELTNREFELLEFLMRNERLVVSRERLLDEVWGYDPMAATNTIDVFISNLRRKLEAGDEPRLLHTKRGAGYVLKD